jgi:hypothetical protein
MTDDPIFSRSFGALSPKRLQPNGLYFCLCDGSESENGCKGEGSREVARHQLTQRAVSSCRRCANANKHTPNKPVIEKPLELEPVKVEIPKCHPHCYVKDGWSYHSPDCERLGVMNRIGFEFRRKAEPVPVGF